MPNNVTVVFDADTQRFRANVDAAGQSVSKAADAVAAAKNRILDSFNAQASSAQRTGASSQQLASIQSRAAQQMANVTEQNATRVIASLDRIQTKQLQVAEASKVLQIGTLSTPTFGADIGEAAQDLEKMGQAGEHAVTGVQASSAAIRALQGDIFANRRAAEVFASTLGPLSDLIGKAFPVIGAIALGAALFKMGEAAYKAYENVVNLRGAIEALNKAQITVDKRVGSLQDQTEQHVEDILTKNSGRSVGLQQKLSYQSQKPLDLSEYFYSEGVKKLPNDVKGNYETLYKSVAPQDVPDRLHKITSEVKALQDALAFNQQGNFGAAITKVGDFGADSTRDPVAYIQARLTMAKQIQSELQAASDDHAAGLDAISSDIGEAQKQEAEKRQRAAEEATRKAQEAARKATEAQRQLWQAEDDQLKQAGGDTAALEAWMWQQRIDAHKKGSAGYADQLRYAQHQLAQAREESRKHDAEALKQADAKQAKDQSTQFDLQRDDYVTSGHRTPQQIADLAGIQMLEALPANIKEATDRWREAQAAADRYAEEAQKAADKAAEAAIQQTASVELASIALAEQTGQISRLDAAQQIAAIHAQQYADQMVMLRKALDDANAKDPNGAEAINAQAAIDKADAQRSIQVMQDTARTAADTWQGALKNANAAWVQDAEDSAKQVAQFYQQALNGINDQLANAMTGEKTNWSGMFRGLGKTLAADGLKRMEAPVLNALGLGKNDGSDSNPFAVKIVGGGGGAFGSGLSKGLSGIFGGGSDDGSDDAGDSSGSFLGSLAGFASKAAGFVASIFGGGKAVGGGVDAGKFYLVGEQGPELLRMGSSSGSIIPNHALGGNHASYTINVANGVTPEQMHMHVQSALRQFHPQVVRDSVAAGRDMQLRTPSSHR